MSKVKHRGRYHRHVFQLSQVKPAPLSKRLLVDVCYHRVNIFTAVLLQKHQCPKEMVSLTTIRLWRQQVPHSGRNGCTHTKQCNKAAAVCPAWRRWPSHHRTCSSYHVGNIAARCHGEQILQMSARIHPLKFDWTQICSKFQRNKFMNVWICLNIIFQQNFHVTFPFLKAMTQLWSHLLKAPDTLEHWNFAPVFSLVSSLR